MFTFNGKEFRSKTAAAIELVSSGKSVSEAANAVGISYQTVYVNTVGKEKRKKQMAKLHVKKLLLSKKNYSKSEIARRAGVSEKLVRDISKNVISVSTPVENTEENTVKV